MTNLKEQFLNERLLKSIIVFFVVILILLSGASIFFGFVELSKYKISISPQGLIGFIDVFLEYKEIFAGLFITIASYLAIHQLIEIKKNNYKSTWFTILKEDLNEIRPFNDYIYRNVLLQSNNIYEYASQRGFEIKNKQELKKFIDSFFDKSIPVFELYDTEYEKYGGIYRDKESTYADRRLLSAIIRLLQPSKDYIEDFTKDYLEIYRHYVFIDNEFSHPTIDKEKYELKIKELTEAYMAKSQQNKN